MPEACHKSQVQRAHYFEWKMVRWQARREQTESYNLPVCCATLHVNVNRCSPFLEPFERQGSSWGCWGSRDLHEVIRDWRYHCHVKVVLLSNNWSLPVFTSQDLSIDQCWTGKDQSFGVWSGLWPFGHWSRLVLVLVNPKLGPKTGPDRTLKYYIQFYKLPLPSTAFYCLPVASVILYIYTVPLSIEQVLKLVLFMQYRLLYQRSWMHASFSLKDPFCNSWLRHYSPLISKHLWGHMLYLPWFQVVSWLV